MDTAKIFLGLAAVCWLGWGGYEIFGDTETEKRERQVKALEEKQQELEKKLDSPKKSVEETNEGDGGPAQEQGAGGSSGTEPCKYKKANGTTDLVPTINDRRALDFSNYFEGDHQGASAKLDDASRANARLETATPINSVTIKALQSGQIVLILTKGTKEVKCQITVEKQVR